MSSPGADSLPTTWLGAAGTGTSFGIAKTMREQWGHKVRIIAADIFASHLIATSLFADEFVQVPLSSDPAFEPFVLRRLVETGTDLYVPILDEEIVWAAELNARGGLPSGVRTTAPSPETARICHDKNLTAAWLQRNGLPTPRTVPIAEAQWEGVALFAKPRCGRGSIGARVVETANALDVLVRSGGDLIVQPLCELPEYTVDVFRSGDGRLVRAVARERLEVKAGVCTKARVFEDDTLEALADRLSKGLDLRGAFCFQVMREAAGGRFVITDVNARPGAGTRLTVACGVNILAATFADVWGGTPNHFLPRLERERHVVRQYEEYVLA